MNKSLHNSNRFSRGFTLVEILVVLVIALVVLSIAIPRIRTINEERNTRETARLVGSAFASASQRAAIDGVAGVRITRNPNFLQGGPGSFQFAATQISRLRAVPNFTGDTVGAEITGSAEAAGTVSIAEPLEQATLDIIQNGDSISFGSSSVRYQITNVTGFGSGTLTLTLDRGFDDYLPIPEFDGAAGADNPSYVVYRLPRVLPTSLNELPDNYIIDLRFSGFEVLDGGDPSALPPVPPQLTTVFEPELNLTPVVTNYIIDFVFDEEGSVDRVFYRDAATGDTVATRIPLGPMFFYVTEAPSTVALTDEVASSSDVGLWVSVSNSSGSTNIGYNNSLPSEGLTYQTLSDYYNAEFDADLIPEMDRDEFNQILRDSRDNSYTSSANQ